MEFQDELRQIRQAGIEKAATIWETLENTESITPADIYKAVTSAKCSEFANRVRTHRLVTDLLKLVVQFFEDTLAVVGIDEGSVSEGARTLLIIADQMPLTDDVYNDPVAYAVRQHTYDGLLLLAAAKLGKEVETKKCIDDMQQGIKNLLIMSYLKGGLSSETIQ